MNRKVFIQTAGRWTILGLLTLLAAIFIKQKAITVDPECSPEFCSSCSLRDSCKIRESGNNSFKPENQNIENK